MERFMGKKAGLVLCGLLVLAFFCAAETLVQGDTQGDIILGFVQVSAEGTWRMTNTKSIKKAAEEAGIHLIFREGENNYSNQIKEMRELIAMGVDVLAFSPSQVDVWDSVLEEARDAGIPVIVLDRAINVTDSSLYLTHIGSDMIEEGRRAARWLLAYMKTRKREQDEIRVAILEGVQGSTPAVHRNQGFLEILDQYPQYKIVQSEPANYIFSKGEEVMSKFLHLEDGKIDVVFAHNDEMALGAIEAIKKFGKQPGTDIVVIGVDAIKKALEAIMKGEMNCSVECSPLLGPQLMEAVRDVVKGRPVPKRVVTVEYDYDETNAAQEFPNRTY